MSTIVINPRSNKVIKKSESRKNVTKKGGQNNELFSGKVLGFEIPGARAILKNKTAQKIFVGAGIVSTELAIVQLINNSTLNKFAAKKEVRILAAGVGGDIPGAAFQFFKEDGARTLRGLQSNGNGAQQQLMFNQPGLA